MKDLRILGRDEYTLLMAAIAVTGFWSSPSGGPCQAFWKTLMKGESALIQAQDGKEGAGNAGVPKEAGWVGRVAGG